jgi:putative transcription factor
MLCELCGNKEAGFKIKLEGAELEVCGDCKTTEAVEIEQKPIFLRETPSNPLELQELLPDFGERIRNGRKEKDIGRGDLAYKLGIKESFLSRIEKGELEPDEKIIHKLEKELEITLRGSLEFKMPPRLETSRTTLGDIVELK